MITLVVGLEPAINMVSIGILQVPWPLTTATYHNFQFVQYLKDHPDSTYDELAGKSGVNKARTCQMVALYNRLPARITDYLKNTDELEVLKYFTERRLRPLTLLASDDEKLKKFDETTEAIL